MAHLERKSRKYKPIIPEKMVKHIVACIKKVPENQRHLFLDSYEVTAIKNPSRWVRNAPFFEVMIILEKIGYMNVWQMMDERNPFKCAELEKATKELYRTGKYDKLIEGHKTHSYYCLSGREILKEQYLCSLLVGGNVFKPNPDTKYFIKSARNKNFKNQKGIDEFIANLYETSEIGDLNFNDWKILYLIRRWDDTPVKVLAIQGRLDYTMQPPAIQRHLNKLSRHGYLDKYGLKKETSYALTSKGWKAMIDAKQRFFQGIRFWDMDESFEIKEENKINGSTINSESTKETNTEFERQGL